MIIKTLLLTIFILSGCDENMSTSALQQNEEVKREIGTLNKFISLPRKPVEVKWEIIESKESGNGNINALLLFKEDDKAFILQNSQQFEKQQNDRINAEFYDEWLPAQAKFKINTRRDGDMFELLNVRALQANLFTQTDLSPYVNGSITPLSGGYIFVSLYSM